MNAILASLLVLAAGFFRIEEGADGRWRTYVKEGEVEQGRRMIV